MNTKTGKMGIQKVSYDKLQPYRVWYKGQIIRFCRTLKEAERELLHAARNNILEVEAVRVAMALGKGVWESDNW